MAPVALSEGGQGEVKQASGAVASETFQRVAIGELRELLTEANTCLDEIETGKSRD